MALVEMNADMRILVVDENQGNVDAMKLFLKRIGYRNVASEASSQDAFRRARTAGADFILCRQTLSFANGLALFEELKADLSIERIPFAIYEENLTQADVALLLEYGVDGYLSLPFSGKELAELLASTWARYLDKGSPEFLFEQARRHYVSGQLEAAGRIFAGLLKAGKLMARSLVALGRLARRQGNRDEALRLARRAAEEFPDYVHAHQFLGEVLLDSGDKVNALDAFMRAIAISPKNGIRYEIVGELLGSLGLWADAELLYRRARGTGLTQAVLTAGLASSLANQGKSKEAIALYRELIQEEPRNTAYLNNLATCHKNEGDTGLAASYYGKALEIEPANTRIRYNLALLDVAMGRKTEAMAHLEQVVAIEPGYEKARRKLAELKGIGGASRPGSAQLQGEAASVPQDVALRVQALLESLEGRETRAAQKSGVPTFPISEEEKKRVLSLSEKQALEMFREGATSLRHTLLRVLEAWKVSVSTSSEEIAGTIGEVVTAISDLTAAETEGLQELLSFRGESMEARKRIAGSLSSRDQVFQNAVYGLVVELQFQDFLTQSLQGLVKAESATLAAGDAEAAAKLPQILSGLPSEALRNRFKGTFVEICQGRATRLGLLAAVEKFAVETLEMLAGNVGESCQRMGAAIDAMRSDPSQGWQEVQKLVARSLEKGTAEGLDGLSAMLDAENQAQSHLSALLGVTRFYLLVSGRLRALAEVVRVVAGLNPEVCRGGDSRRWLLAYGLHLEHVWRHAEMMCSSVAEQTLLRNAVSARGG